MLDNQSKFDYNDNIIAFQSISGEGATLTINAEQSTAEKFDTIAMGGRESLTLSGKQTTMNGNTYFNAFLTIPTRLNHVVLFEQSTLSIPDFAKSFEVSFLSDVITVTSINNDIYQITSGANNYNIFLPDGKITYITDADNQGFYKLWHKDNKIFVTLVGIYTDGELSITVKEEFISET